MLRKLASAVALATVLAHGACVGAEQRELASDRGGANRHSDRQKPQEPPPPPYYEDERFNKPLHFGTTVFGGIRVVQALSQQIGAHVLLESQFLNRLIPTELDAKPARDTMDFIAGLWRGRWEKIGDTYAFVADPRLAAALALTRDEQEALINAGFSHLLDSLTPRQLAVLHSRGQLSLSAWAAPLNQQRILENIGILCYATITVWPVQENLDGNGFSLRVASSDAAPGVELWVARPTGREHKVGSRPLGHAVR